MKFLSIVLFFALPALGFAQAGYKIDVKIKNTKDTVCYLGYPYGEKKFVQDTAKIQKGNLFTFQKPDTLEKGIYFIYTPNSIYFEIIVDAQKISIETDTTDLVKNMKIIGSEESTIFRNFQMFMSENQQKAADLSARMKSDKANEEKYKAELVALDKKVKDYRANIIEENPDLFVAKLIKSTIEIQVPESPTDENGNEIDPSYRFNYYRQHYFDNLDFSEPAFLRSPILYQKIEEYLEKLTYKHPDSIIASAHFIIEKSKANKEVFRYCVVSISNKYETSKIMGMDGVFVDLAESYYLTGQAYWADKELVEKIAKRVQELKPLIGDKATNIIALDTSENVVPLYSLDNDFVVLYFYDPDCGHCKKKTPELQKIYESQLIDMGVEVYAASTNTDTKKWKDFIKKFNLTFINVADPYTQSNFRADYYIDHTPKIYVIDSHRKIIAKSLDVEQLVDFISKQQELNQ